MSKYLVIIICVFCIAAGQVLFKLSANNLRDTLSIWTLFFDPLFILAVLIYGLTTIGWVWCLQEIPLSRAYLFMALGYIVVPVFGILFFKEALTMRYFLSMLLIISGILCSIW